MQACRQSGFTLVELAIVLVIIGLIVGGVLVGQDLIRGAELRQIMTDKERIQGAVGTFRNKYNALPGDMRNATDIWGAADADPVVCPDFLTTSPGPTCNGDGSKELTAGLDTENFLFWHHLGNANLYAATPVPDADLVVMLDSFPKPSWLPGTFYWVSWSGGYIDNTTDFFEGNYGHIMLVMGYEGDGMGGGSLVPSMTVQDVMSLDQKFDDGLVVSGQIVSLKNGAAYAPGCATTNDPATAAYDTSATGLQCSTIFKNVF